MRLVETLHKILFKKKLDLHRQEGADAFLNFWHKLDLDTPLIKGLRE